MSETYASYSFDDEDQLQAEDTLVDRGVGDVLDEGYSPPDRIPASHRYGFTAAEEHAGESLAQRLEQEEPDVTVDDDLDENSPWPDDMQPDVRAGRLVAPDGGMYLDEDQAPLAYDIGIDGAGASAEEAAMHVEGESDEWSQQYRWFP